MMHHSLAHTCILGGAFACAAAHLIAPSSSIAQTGQSSAPSPIAKGSTSSAQFQKLSARAMADLDADKLDDAIPLLHKALMLNPRWVEGWWSLGTAYYDQDRYAEAAFAFQKVVALDSKHGTAHAMLGLCDFELGEDVAALKEIEVAKGYGTDIDPQLRDVVFYHEGLLLQRAGRFVQSQQAFSSLCIEEHSSGLMIPALGMAALHLRDKTLPSPESDEGQAIQIVGHATCFAAQKDFVSASREFTLAASRFPKLPYVHYAYGRALLDAENVNGAVEEFKRELAVGHDPILPRLQIAAAEYKTDSASGLPYAKEAVQLAPQMPFAHFLLGLLLLNTGEFEKAVPELENASKGLPDQPDVFWSLASAYGHVGRTHDALKARAEFARLKQKAAQEPGAEQASEDVPLGNLSGDGAPQPK